MGLIAPSVSIAARPHRVAIDNPAGPPVPDGEGGYTQAWAPADPPYLYVHIRTAGAADLERLKSGTVTAVATHAITGPFHSQITTHTRLRFEGRIFNVVGIASPEARKIDTVLLVAEVLDPALEVLA